MKMVQGETLAKRIGPPGTPRSERELRQLLEIFLKVCDAVAFAHSRHVIHRDLKPDNVMIGEFGQVYVMDWGCAHVVRQGKKSPEGAPRRTFHEADGTVIGTPGYMAPEQAWGATAELDERTDIFGLGGILYQMLTGEPPYPDEHATAAVQAARRGEPKIPRSFTGTAAAPPAGLRKIVVRALATKREDRYDTVDELKSEVESFLRGGSFFTSRTFPAGTIIVREGDPADEAYVVTAGRCEAFRKQRGRRVALRTFGPSDVFGEAAIFAAGARRNASVVALDDVTVVIVSREILHEELALDSWMGAFVRALALRHRDFEARHELSERVAEHARAIGVIVGHVSRAGAWVRTSALETQWSRAWETLAPELHLSEATVLALIASSGDLSVDLARDALTLEVTAVE